MAAMRVKEVKEGCDTDAELSDDVQVKEQEEEDAGGEVDYRWVHSLVYIQSYDDLRSFIVLIYLLYSTRKKIYGICQAHEETGWEVQFYHV